VTDTALATAAAALAVALGLLAPGWLAVRALGLGADRLERFVLAVAIGRCLAGAAGLAAAETGAWAWLTPAAVLAGVLSLTLAGRARMRSGSAGLA